MKPSWALRTARRTVCLLIAIGGAGSAHADLWSLESRLASRLEVNDNYRLEPEPTSARTLSLSGGFDASRQTEAVKTRLSADLSLYAASPEQARQRRADASLNFSHAVSGPLDTLSGALKLQRDSTLERRTTASEAVLGTGERRETSGTGNWSHQLTERASANLGLAVSSTRFGAEVSGAVDFDDARLAGGWGYRLSDTDSLGLQLTRSDYRAESVGNRSLSTGVNLSWRHALSERSVASLAVGGYRSNSRTRTAVLVCPLPIEFCNAGLVSPVLAQREGESSSTGAQFDGSLSYETTATSGVVLAASRQLQPSGAGALTRSDALSIGAHGKWSDTLSASASASLSRSTFLDTNRAEPRLRVLSFALTQALRPDASLEFSARQTRSDMRGSGIGATAHVVAVVLTLQGPPSSVSR